MRPSLRPAPATAAALLLPALLAGACHRAAADTEPAVAAPPPVSAAAPEPQGGAMPHGDHAPHHGGTVWMYKDVHFEVVFDPAGRHHVYFSDAVRQDLPASVASAVTVTVERPGFSPETVRAVVDEQGESWIADGAPVKEEDVSAKVGFTMGDEAYWIDLPFIPAAR